MSSLVSMTHPNKRKGNNYEYRFIEKRIKEGATWTERHYGSLGITDVEWRDKEGVLHEAQLKFSSKKFPKVYGQELRKIEKYAQMRKGQSKVWLVCKMSNKPELWKAMN